MGTPAFDKFRIRISSVLYLICSAVPTGTPVSDKFCLCIITVVPTGTHVSDKSCICISPVVPMGTPASE